ncbi:SDR family oxidoreductase [Dyella telluris]|uniref:NAD-dependent epimerase/dehydratase family protein n=1 Tax=Dyella telluris TaxID=2763498 RepID=A0A7G8Q0D8_9GAMM|nr:NAD-dependent epimerase/dehydratase family protein [Dyella telluris]QNK00246.1 NAD-dependent epimerase/dehydratase family protein [Dyella telluris]
MTVVVFGASTQIGHFLLPRLRERGVPVLALSRKPRPAQAGVQWLQGKLPGGVPELGTPTAVISFGPLKSFAEWLDSAGLPASTRVIATSSMSAESKQASDVPAEREISQTLREGEAALAATCDRQGQPWTIFRPTIIYGAGIDKSLTPIAQRASRLHVFPLPAGRGLRQPVHADDIAAAVVAALDHPASAGHILPLGGGERLTAGEMFARVRRSLATPTLPLPIPAALLRLGRHAVPRLRGPLTRLEANLIADNSELQRLLGISPRPFRPDAACWTPQPPL